MNIREIKQQDIMEALAGTNLVSASLEYAKFCQNFWQAEPFYLGIFDDNKDLAAILVLFRWREDELVYLGASLKIYTEFIFLKSIKIDTKKITAFIKKNYKFDILDLAICPILSGERGFEEKWRTATLVLKVPAGAEGDEVLAELDKKTRNQIKKSYEYQLIKETGTDWQKFYPLYCQTMERLSACPKKPEYFESLATAFGDKFQVLLAEKEGKVLGGNVFVVKGNYLMLLFNASSPEGWRCNVNNFLYWEMIKEGLEQGVKYFDFGLNARRDRDQIHFKTGFGAKIYPVEHFLKLNSPKAVFYNYEKRFLFLLNLINLKIKKA